MVVVVAVVVVVVVVVVVALVVVAVLTVGVSAGEPAFGVRDPRCEGKALHHVIV